MRVVHDDESSDEDNWTVLRAVWDTECEAFEIVGRDPKLAQFMPDGFRRLNVAAVYDTSGQEISERFLLDCAYRMARIAGNDVKIGGVLEKKSPMAEVLGRFERAGVKHLWDGSVFIPGKDAYFTFIDIASDDVINVLTPILSATGKLPEWARQRWGSQPPVA